MFEGIRTKLQGAKTYLVALGVVITAVVAFLNGEADFFQTAQLAVTAIIGATLRAGISSK